jgi:N4-gp56 family major capsid protein
MNLNTTTQVDPAVATFYDRVLLKRGLPYKVHDRFGQIRSVKQRSGNTIKFRRYGALPVAATPLVEGVTPTGKTVTKTDITATLKQYGDYIHFSDMVSLTNQDPVLTEFAELLGEQSGETLDIIYRDYLVAGSNVYYGGSYSDSSIDTRAEVNTAPVPADFKKIREIMVGNKAKMIAERMKASGNVGTLPVPPAYWAIVHHELQNDLEDMTGWLPAHKYPNSMPAYPEEIGALPDANIRFLITQNGKVWADSGGSTSAGTVYRSTSGSNVDVYACLIFGKNAYGICPLEGANLKNIVKAVGSSGSSDPLDQRGSSGWKAVTTACILNDLFMIRAEFAATL